MITDEIREISPFMVKNMPLSYSALHIGVPGSGKTFTIQALAYMQSHIYAVANISCGTEDGQSGFAPLFGDVFVTSKFDPDMLEMACARQMKCKSEKCPSLASFNVVDDLGGNKKNYRHSVIINSIKNGTQWFHRAFHLGIHSVREINDDLVGFSYIFVYYIKDDTDRRRTYNRFFKVYISEYKDFCNLMDDLLGDNKKGALVVDIRKQSSKLEDCVFIFRPPYWTWNNPSDKDTKKTRPYPEGWRFGCQQYKDWNDSRFNKNFVPDFVANLSGKK